MSNLDPRLQALIDKAGAEDGLSVDLLQEGDVLEVETRHHHYRFEMIDPPTGLAAVTSDGSHVAGPVEMFIHGSSLTGTGTMVQMKWIAVGYRLAVGTLLLSATRSVSLNGVRLLPKPVAGKH